MEIFFTDYHQLAEISSNEQNLVEALRSAGVSDRMPFLLASDGSYDLQLNRFFRELPHNGVRSWHSWKSYALDLLTWCRFLQEHRETTVWKATRADLIVYHQARRSVLTPLSSDLTPIRPSRPPSALLPGIEQLLLSISSTSGLAKKAM